MRYARTSNINAYYRANLQQPSDSKIKMLHLPLAKRLAAEYEAQGWTVQREVAGRYGNIDMLAAKDGEQLLVEVKIPNNATALYGAIGQILVYAVDYPDAQLMLAAPCPLEESMLELLAGFGISFYDLRYMLPITR
jgi:hypothetical protein